MGGSRRGLSIPAAYSLIRPASGTKVSDNRGSTVWVLGLGPVTIVDTKHNYRIAGNFRGTKYSRFSNIETFCG